MKKIILLGAMVLFSTFVNAQYEKSIELGGSIGLNDYTSKSYEIDMINGYRFNKTFFAGVGVGFRLTDALYYKTNILTNNIESRDNKYLIPAYAQIKANLSSGNLSPFILANVGYTFDVGKNDNKNTYGLMLEPAFGIDINVSDASQLYFLIGYSLQNAEYNYYMKSETIVQKGMAQSISLRGGIRF